VPSIAKQTIDTSSDLMALDEVVGQESQDKRAGNQQCLDFDRRALSQDDIAKRKQRPVPQIEGIAHQTDFHHHRVAQQSLVDPAVLAGHDEGACPGHGQDGPRTRESGLSVDEYRAKRDKEDADGGHQEWPGDIT
jgi:hypothetical protein